MSEELLGAALLSLKGYVKDVYVVMRVRMLGGYGSNRYVFKGV